MRVYGRQISALVVLIFPIIFLCIGISAVPVSAEEQGGMWVLKDIQYDQHKNTDDIAYTTIYTLTATSATLTIINKGNPKPNDWSSSASWEAPPKTLQPGSKVHVSGHIVRNSYTDGLYESDGFGIGFVGPGCYGWGTICPPYYGEDYWSKGEVRSKEPAIAEATLDKDISVPSKDTEVSLTYQTAAGRVCYVYTYQEQPKKNLPPTVTLHYSPKDPNDQDGITFKADAKDPDGDKLIYIWYVGNRQITGLGNSPEIHQTLDAGEYECTVKVIDDKGAKASDRVRIAVKEKVPNEIGNIVPHTLAEETPARPQIIGDSDSAAKINKALDLLSKNASYYALVCKYIGVIEVVEQGSGMVAYDTPPRFLLSKKLISLYPPNEEGIESPNNPILLAGVILHDACHSALYHFFLLNHPRYKKPPGPPDEVWSGEKAEIKCVHEQYNAVKWLGGNEEILEDIKNSIKSKYWEIPYEQRWW